MASADLRDELNCSICLSLYTDPVSLRCGHNFCRSCIVSALDAQEAAGVYSCPDCRAEYPQRPALEKNRKLGNIVERFLSTQPDMEETRIFCTYCTKSPVPAVKSCLQCENSLCDDHLTAHNKTMDHILIEPTGFFGNKKCSIHKKVLELYCPQDAACLCVFCCLVGKHKGHQVELLEEASEKKKKKLRKYLEELNPQKAEIQTRVQNLHEHKRNIQEKASDKRKNVSKIFIDIKKQLEMAENKALSEISRQEEKIVSQISDVIKKLEIKEDELSRRMRHVEEMCHVTDPIRVLQESDITVCSPGDDEDTGEDGGKKATDPKTVLQESDQGATFTNNSIEGEEASVSHQEELCHVTDPIRVLGYVHKKRPALSCRRFRIGKIVESAAGAGTLISPIDRANPRANPWQKLRHKPRISAAGFTAEYASGFFRHAFHGVNAPLQESDITACSPGDEDTGGDGVKSNSENDVDTGLVSGQADVHMSDTKVQDDGTDPKTVLQESDQGVSCSDRSMVREKAPVSDLHEPADDLDEVLMSLTLHRSMRDIITNVTSELGFHVADILLDVDTACMDVKVTGDLKTATDFKRLQHRHRSSRRFKYYPQVLSRCGLSSGRHYWEVNWNWRGRCEVGMCYPSIERDGDESGLGDNDKSWCLVLKDAEYSTQHNSIVEMLHSEPTCPTFGVFLDYEAGHLSFYELCDPIRHLHTFTASFTEPLHVIFYLDYGASVTIRS